MPKMVPMSAITWLRVRFDVPSLTLSPSPSPSSSPSHARSNSLWLPRSCSRRPQARREFPAGRRSEQRWWPGRSWRWPGRRREGPALERGRLRNQPWWSGYRAARTSRTTTPHCTTPDHRGRRKMKKLNRGQGRLGWGGGCFLDVKAVPASAGLPAGEDGLAEIHGFGSGRAAWLIRWVRNYGAPTITSSRRVWFRGSVWLLNSGPVGGGERRRRARGGRDPRRPGLYKTSEYSAWWQGTRCTGNQVNGGGLQQGKGLPCLRARPI